MKIFNLIFELFLNTIVHEGDINISVQESQPYWSMVSKGMTKSSSDVVITVLFVLLLMLSSLAIWARFAKRKDKKKISKLNWTQFNITMKERRLSEADIKLLKEIILKCSIENPETIYKEIPFFEYKLQEYINKKVKKENISQVLLSNSNLARLNDEITNCVTDIREAFDFFTRGQNISDVSSRQMRTGYKVFLRVDKHPKSIETKVKNNTSLYLSVESNNFIKSNLSAGEMVDLFYERDGQYRMKMKVLEVNEFDVKLVHTTELTRTQKRNFVRYAQKLSIRYKFFHRVNKELMSDIVIGNILDISGGGIKFNTREEIFKDDVIVAFGMWDDLELKFKAKILKTDEIETAAGIVYVGYCIFVDVDKQFVDKIIKKIFSEISKDLNKSVL